MERKHELVLLMNYEFLLKNLDVDGVLPKLVGSQIFNLDDCERVKAEVTTEDKAGKLLKILTRKGDKAYDVFLKSADPHIQSQLESTEVPEDVLEKGNYFIV